MSAAKPRIRKITLALLLLQLRLHHVGMRYFARRLALVRQIGEACGLILCALGHGHFVLTRGEAVIETDHRRHQPTSRDFVLGRSPRCCRIGQPHIGDALQSDRLRHRCLAGVLVHRIVCDKYDRRGSLGTIPRCRAGLANTLRVEKLVVIYRVRQQRRACNRAIERSRLRLSPRRREVRARSTARDGSLHPV